MTASKFILQPGSPYINRHDPITKQVMQPGAPVVECPSGRHVFLQTSWEFLGGKCPLCAQAEPQKQSIKGPQPAATPQASRQQRVFQAGGSQQVIIALAAIAGAAILSLAVVVIILLLRPGPAGPAEAQVTATQGPSVVVIVTSSAPQSTALPASSTPPALAPIPIDLQPIGNSDTDFRSPPLGEVEFDGIPFRIPPLVFKSQASTGPNDAFPTEAHIDIRLSSANRMYLLLNAGNAFNRFRGREIGLVRVNCGGEWVDASRLVLGQNIREWRSDSNVVSAAPETVEVWTGTIAPYPSLSGHVDLLDVPLPASCSAGPMSGIKITDNSRSTVSSLDPALNLFGITVNGAP